MFPGASPYILSDKTLEDFAYPRNKNYPLTESWELGGKDLNNTSVDLDTYAWFAWTDGSKVYLKRDDLDTIYALLEDIDITEIDITFDQNMRPCVVYVSNNIVKMFWYDTATSEATTTSYPPDYQRPRVSLDDKRRFATSVSDIIFAYQRGPHLCYRVQRERFTVEYILHTETTKKFLWRIGMGRNYRFLFQWR